MTRTIVCFGDSNTHGANPSGHGTEPAGPRRLPRAVRWPRVMEAALGEGYEVIEEGLNGRCTIWDSEIEPGRNGLTYLLPCLLSHAPVDLVTIMLGTNDLKSVYGNTAAEIACGAARLVDVARGSLAGPDGSPPEVLLVSPVPLGEITARSEMWGFGAAYGTSRQLARMYAIVADDHGAGFLDAGSVASVHPDDGVHLDAAACASLGAAMADAVRARLEHHSSARP
jgi:lysophospholipase L1-like esterase